MEMHIDFVNPETGRVLLYIKLDAPVHLTPKPITRRSCQKILSTLRKTLVKLQQEFGAGSVRLTIDSQEAAIFWYLLFFRPITFDPEDPWFGGRSWNVYQLLADERYAYKIKEMDLGLVYDADHNWLIVMCKEAEAGVLADLDMHPSWKRLRNDYAKRTGMEAPPDWWKYCAHLHSFTVPKWRVYRERIMKRALWHRPDHHADDVIVFDLAGIDTAGLINAHAIANNAPGMENAKALGCDRIVPKHARFVHFYTEDPQAFKHVQQFKKKVPQRSPAYKMKATIAAEKRREEKKIKFVHWVRASSAVLSLAKLFRCGQRGTPALYLSGERGLQIFHLTAQKQHSGNFIIDPDNKYFWFKVNRELDTLEECLRDNSVPQELAIWLKWRRFGADVEALAVEEAAEVWAR